MKQLRVLKYYPSGKGNNKPFVFETNKGIFVGADRLVEVGGIPRTTLFSRVAQEEGGYLNPNLFRPLRPKGKMPKTFGLGPRMNIDDIPAGSWEQGNIARPKAATHSLPVEGLI
jgi:hypothetical protein